MKVALDISPLESAHQGRGVGTYTRLLAQFLQANDQTNLIQSTHPYQETADLVHYPYFDLFFHTLPFVKPLPTVVTIHDTIPLIFPTHFPKGPKGQLSFWLQKLSLSSVKAVITDSKSSQKDIAHYLNYPLGKIHIVPLASDPIFKKLPPKQTNSFKKTHLLTSPIISYVGDINYNKNLPRLIQAVGNVAHLTLVIVTRADLDGEIPEVQAIRQTLESLPNKNKVRFLKLDKPQDLVTLYSVSDWYIQPSLYEGFGLPILEAMNCSLPVICSSQSSLPEIAGEAAIYFEPSNPKSIKKAITQALSMPQTQRKQLISKCEQQVKKFSWKRTAAQTIKVYHTVLNS